MKARATNKDESWRYGVFMVSLLLSEVVREQRNWKSGIAVNTVAIAFIKIGVQNYLPLLV